MIGVIPNPKKSITVDFPLGAIKEAVTFIRDIDKRYALHSINDVFNQYTYQAGEFLSFGVFIDINLSSQSETKTQINIEVRRKIGAFDKAFEVQYGNQHIENMIICITNALQMTDAQKATIKEKYKVKEGSATPEKGLSKFNCGICKKAFYADSSLNNIAICPHCKISNSLPKVNVPKGCAGMVAFIFVAGGMMLLLLFAIIH